MDQQTPLSAHTRADSLLHILPNHFQSIQLHVIVHSRNCLFDNHRYMLIYVEYFQIHPHRKAYRSVLLADKL